MENKDLKKRLAEVKAQLKKCSTDTHFTEKLIGELLSVYGQMNTKPIPMDMGEIKDTFSGDTFEMGLTTYGAYYKTYGGYIVYVNRNQTSLYELIYDYVTNKDEYEQLEGEVRESFALTLSAVAYCLSLPSFVCSDENFLFDTAGNVVTFLREKSEQILNEELKEETEEDIKANLEFKNAALALEDVKKSLKSND